MLREKTILLLFCGLTCILSANAQYYYQDIYNTLETNRQHEQYRANRVQSVRILSLDAQKQPSPGFHCSKTFSPDYRQTTTVTKSFSTGADRLISFFDTEGKIIRTIDSAANSTSQTRIYYNRSGKIDSLVFLSYAAEQMKTDSFLRYNARYRLRETHIYYYDSSGVVKKMERKKNNRLYSTIYFEKDGAGHVFKEYEKNNGRPVYYYKYKNNRLTDVFHYNNRRKKMIPDYLFDFDEQGRLTTKTVVLANSHNFLEWHYSYNQKGQINKQLCYNDDKELQGSLIFKYRYQP